VAWALSQGGSSLESMIRHGLTVLRAAAGAPLLKGCGQQITQENVSAVGGHVTAPKFQALAVLVNLTFGISASIFSYLEEPKRLILGS